MQAKRVTLRTGKKAWRFRLWHPGTGKRTWKVFNFVALRDAEKARDLWLECMERRKLGIADNTGWTIPFCEAVEKFLKEAPIASERRRARLRQALSLNELGLATLADLCSKSALTAKCMALQKVKSDVYVIKCCQQPLKQLAAWAAGVDLLPVNPLAIWKSRPLGWVA